MCLCPKGRGGQISFSEPPKSQESLHASALRVRRSHPGHEALALDLAVSCEPYRPHQTIHERGSVWTALQRLFSTGTQEGAGGEEEEEEERLEMQRERETFALRMCSPELAQVNDGEPGRIP